MNWYQGNIAEAVAMSKTKNAIFVVYIEGKDELTQKLSGFINEPKIKTKLESDDFVAIKIESDSEAYMQFAKIYQVVPVPSIFFIGSTGAPLEIGTGIIASAEDLDVKIERVLATSGKAGSSTATASATLIAAEQTAAAAVTATTSAAAIKKEPAAEEIICEGDVCHKQPVEPETANTPKLEKLEGLPETSSDAANTSPNMEETRKQLEQKRRERVELEKQQEKEREVRRRRDGKEVQQLQSWQKEQELKELKENIRRERMEEQAARERIRAQIAGDRAERAQKMAAETQAATVSASTATTPQSSSSSGSARLQFRLPTGESKTQSFGCAETLGVVRDFVTSELLPGTGIRNFILATTYPKREFSAEHDTQTLMDLGLFPSAVILVIGRDSSSNPAAIIARSGGIVNMLSGLFWAMLSPVFAVFGYLKKKASGRGAEAEDAAANAGAQKRANEEQGAQHDAAKRRNLERFLSGPSTSQNSAPAAAATAGADAEANATKPYRRYVGGSNIHRLTDKSKDSDDENATWNGNSTQQQ